jgi:hypothetical protein
MIITKNFSVEAFRHLIQTNRNLNPKLIQGRLIGITPLSSRIPIKSRHPSFLKDEEGDLSFVHRETVVNSCLTIVTNSYSGVRISISVRVIPLGTGSRP